jgi:Flp pilus assembly protein TadB
MFRAMSEMGESGDGEPSAAELVTRLSEQVSRLIRDELQLALTELKQKAKRAGIGGGLIGAAGAVALLGLGALMIAAIVALARLLPLWAAALIVGGAALLLAGLLASLGIDQLKSAIPPTPEQAIASIKRGVPG